MQKSELLVCLLISEKLLPFELLLASNGVCHAQHLDRPSTFGHAS